MFSSSTLTWCHDHSERNTGSVAPQTWRIRSWTQRGIGCIWIPAGHCHLLHKQNINTDVISQRSERVRSSQCGNNGSSHPTTVRPITAQRNILPWWKRNAVLCVCVCLLQSVITRKSSPCRLQIGTHSDSAITLHVRLGGLQVSHSEISAHVALMCSEFRERGGNIMVLWRVGRDWSWACRWGRSV